MSYFSLDNVPGWIELEDCSLDSNLLLHLYLYSSKLKVLKCGSEGALDRLEIYEEVNLMSFQELSAKFDLQSKDFLKFLQI